MCNQIKRAEIRQLKASLTVKQWENIKDIFNYKCAYCGMEMDDLQQEHVIPVSKGGGYSVENIIPACERCNSSKRNLDFFEWYPRQSFYSKERETKIIEYIKSQGGILKCTKQENVF